MVAARSAASARFRAVLLVAAPMSANVFQTSSMIKTRWLAPRTHTSIDLEGSAGRVGSSNVAVRPVSRASISKRSCIARWPESVGARNASSGREKETANG
jgi:hypothetical protein